MNNRLSIVLEKANILTKMPLKIQQQGGSEFKIFISSFFERKIREKRKEINDEKRRRKRN